MPSPAIQKLEFDCARDYDLVAAQESGDERRILDVLERDYRQRVIQQYGSLELRGIQLNHRVTLDLDRVYVPLHLEEQCINPGPLPLTPSRVPVPQALSKHRLLLILGSPGSGKSTAVSALANGCAAYKLPAGANWKPRSLPLVLAVRTLKSPTVTSASLKEALDISKEVLERALEEKRVVLFVDGLDEAAKAFRQDLITSLTKFVHAHPDVRLIVTSRRAGPSSEIESCLPGAVVFRLAKLTKSEIDEFVDKWCIAAETSARGNDSEAIKQAQAAADDLKSRIARSMPIQRIAVNPLLTTILLVVHRFLGRSIPEHRVELYEECTDALLFFHIGKLHRVPRVHSKQAVLQQQRPHFSSFQTVHHSLRKNSRLHLAVLLPQRHHLRVAIVNRRLHHYGRVRSQHELRLRE